jgi:hypothetical protein
VLLTALLIYKPASLTHATVFGWWYPESALKGSREMELAVEASMISYLLNPLTGASKPLTGQLKPALIEEALTSKIYVNLKKENP